MTRAQSVAALAAALGPMDGVPAEVVTVYLEALADVPEHELRQAVLHLIETQEERWWPTVATIRRIVFEQRLGLPAPEEAWQRVQDPEYRKVAPQPVKDALAAMGGSWALKTSERPESFRRGFLAQYEAAKRSALLRASSASRAALAPAVIHELRPGGDAA